MVKKQRRITKRDRKKRFGPGPSTTPPKPARPPKRPLALGAACEAPGGPAGYQDARVVTAAAQEWILGMLEIAALVMVAHPDDAASEPRPLIVCWLTPEESRRFSAAMPTWPRWNEGPVPLFDKVVSAMRIALPDEASVENRVAAHALGVIEMEERMPRWQQLPAPTFREAGDGEGEAL